MMFHRFQKTITSLPLAVQFPRSIKPVSFMMTSAAVLAGLMILAGSPWVTSLAAGEKEDIEILMRASKARAAIVKRIRPAVVHISVEKTVSHQQQQGSQETPEFFNDEFFRKFFGPRLPEEFKQKGLGSGSIVDKRGYILTNNHVVGEADKITVKLPDGREFPAKLVGADPATDLAVIQIKGKDLPIAKLGNSDQLEVGESVIAIGNPFGLEQTITAGIVSAKGRSQVGLTDYEDFIQTDASINPGNSGGPLVGLEGSVVGVNTAIFSRTGGNQGIGFAIPINMAREIMDALIKTGKVTRGFLGVVIQNLTPELSQAMGLKGNNGVLIANVGTNTPAGKAGIRQGDVLMTFNKQPLKSSNELRNIVAGIRPGTKVPVDLVREGKEMTVTVMIEAQPEDMRAAIAGEEKERETVQKDKPSGPEKALGIMVRPLTQEIAQQLGYEGLDGVLVASVDPSSPAGEAGLREGSLIVQVNRNPVKNIQGFKRVLARAPRGKHILFLVRAGRATEFVAIKLPK